MKHPIPRPQSAILPLLFLLAFLHIPAPMQAQDPFFEVNLHENTAIPADSPLPNLRAYLPQTTDSLRRAVLILPGGGYAGLAKNHEGYDWAPFFNQRNTAAFILCYRLPKGQNDVPLADVAQALRTIRRHAAEWHIDPANIGIMGSSAGGHLAATACTLLPQEERPAFQILLYPVISMQKGITHQGSRDNLLGRNPSEALVHRYCCEQHITPATPPAFLVLSDDDDIVPTENSIGYYQALHRAGIPASLHIYPTGGHGWGASTGFRYHRQMTEELSHWLENL